MFYDHERVLAAKSRRIFVTAVGWGRLSSSVMKMVSHTKEWVSKRDVVFEALCGQWIGSGVLYGSARIARGESTEKYI